MSPFFRMAALGAMLAGVCGCPPTVERVPLDPLSLEDAVARVNRDREGVTGALQAQGGSASGHFTDTDGKRRSFSYDAKLLVLAPWHLRFDMTTFNQSHLLFGSDDTRYWVVVKPRINTLWWGRHDITPSSDSNALLVRPDLILDALGIKPLSIDTTGPMGPIPRVTADHQQLIYLAYDDTSQGYVAKEIWMSRYDDRFVDRLVYRNRNGDIIMESRLSSYKPIDSGGPVLPHRVEIDWPTSRSRLTFTTRGWKVLPDVDESHPGFTFPLDRDETFDDVIDLDEELIRRSLPPEWFAPAG